MEKQLLTYKATNQFSNLVLDYLEAKEELRSLYNRPPDLGQVAAQIQEKSKNYSQESRKRLVDAFKAQYRGFTFGALIEERIQAQIQALSSEQTFTVTTGHQLNLFTGPLYFLYKIFGAINLAEQYSAQNPDYKFVPVFWMASEDHDFEEISHFRTVDQKISWNRTPKMCTAKHRLKTKLMRHSAHMRSGN